MEKINLPFFYQLGAHLNALTQMPVEPGNRPRIAWACFFVRESVLSLLQGFSILTVCRGKGTELLGGMDGIAKWMNETPAEKWREPDAAADMTFQQVIHKAREFETVLSAELETLATYLASQKGIYSTPDLIDSFVKTPFSPRRRFERHASTKARSAPRRGFYGRILIAQTEKAFPASIRAKFTPEAVEDIRQSGRCLAFDCATASGFHIMRATEAVMHEYYILVRKPVPTPTKRLDNWGAYISELQKSTDADVKEVVAMLQQIKDRHRNLIMHPEVVLSSDEAFTLFEIAQGAIIAMASKLADEQER